MKRMPIYFHLTKPNVIIVNSINVNVYVVRDGGEGLSAASVTEFIPLLWGNCGHH